MFITCVGILVGSCGDYKHLKELGNVEPDQAKSNNFVKIVIFQIFLQSDCLLKSIP